MNSAPSFSLPLLAGVLCAAASSSASAQSTVSIYGLVDTGVEYVSNVGGGGHVVRMPNLSGSLPSRLGFRGTEDLGGGLTATFTLETGFGVDSGALNQSGRAFGRQAFVGVSGPWGTISLGRQYTMTYHALAGPDLLGPNIHSYADMDAYLANARVDNSIAYRGKFGPWTAGATYSFGRDTAPLPGGANCPGESGTDRKACRQVSGMLRYDAATWGVVASHDVAYGGAGAGGGLVSSELSDARTVLGGYVAFEKGKLGGGMIARKNEGSAATPRSRLYFVGGNYLITPALQADLQVGKLDFENSGNDSLYYAARMMYSLSKRSAVYVSMGRINNKGLAAISVSGGAPAGALPLPGGDQTGAMVGVRHSF